MFLSFFILLERNSSSIFFLSCYINISDEGIFGERVCSIIIVHNDTEIEDKNISGNIGYIGVDAGLAGFFNDKKDFDDEEWSHFCSKIDNSSNGWNMYDGVFCLSGYGDGSYPVYATLERDAFMICKLHVM